MSINSSWACSSVKDQRNMLRIQKRKEKKKKEKGKKQRAGVILNRAKIQKVQRV